MGPDAALLKRLTYAKYLYYTSIDQIRSTSPIVAAEALLRIHDAIEIFQRFVLDSLNVNVPNDLKFMEFWERVKIATTKEPPYKNRVALLNDMRGGFKHKAICPNPADLRDVAAVIQPFFAEVCRDFLGVDFDKVSLADLVDDDRARERLHKADDLIESQNYGEALSEIAIALHIVLAQKYPRSPWASTSDLLDTGPSSDRPPRIPYHRYGNVLSGAGDLIHKIEEGFEKLHDRISRQADLLEMLIWRIDLQEYSKFAQFAPYVSETGGGNFYVVQRGGMQRPLTKRDARFCFQFVLDSALSIQQQKHELPDLFAAQRLKTVARGAKLYKVQNSSLVACGEIPGGQGIDGVYACWSGEETVWQVEWQGVKGFVKNGDVVQLDNQ
jgi:hypothetical protein